MTDTGSGNRFSPITPDDHAGSVWISASLCLVYSVITLGLRGHLRRKIYGVDDYLAFAATVIQIGQVAAIMVGLNHGLGKTQDLLRQSELEKASRAAFAGEIMFILALAAAKGSTLYLMLRLFNLSGPKATSQGRTRMFHWAGLAVLAAMAIWGLLSVIAVSVACPVSTFIEGNSSQCSHQVVLAFAFRLPLVALSVLHLKFISEYTTSQNPGVDLVPALVLQQVQLCWSLMSATIPNLKSFVKSFSSGFGIQLDPASTQAYSSSGRYNRSHGYELGSVGKESKSRSHNRSYHDIENGQGPLPQELQNGNKTQQRDQESIGSVGSQDHIIRKDVQWNVRYETDQRKI
ncbi:hypothetical protein LTR72_007381 [Exophiala xenobiotica]|nr:hypothetical protein LTR92_005445 [Exophiala xenobiotica]KAK5220759.1 hypothetical protein LTR72_007381 [Exophiala xenobiotica]KAK5413718.1 hypothetical protein LTR06_005145 [Exophiala xenobiotica]